MFRIDFEYYDKNTGVYTKDSFETDKFNNFLLWIEDNEILNYEIRDIEVYND